MNGKVTKEQLIFVPCVCPNCGGTLEWYGTDLICPYENNFQLAYKFITTVAPVDNAGYAIYSSIVNGIKSEDDLIDFIKTMNINKIVNNTSGTATKKIVRTICETVKAEIDPVRFLTACNIKGLGLATCKAIMDNYPEFIEDIKKDKLNANRITSIKGLGGATLTAITSNLNRIKNLANVLKIKNHIVVETKETKFKVAITGALSIKRADFDKMLKDHGIEQSGNFKELKYLITNTPESGSSKNQKAREYGIEVITEEEFTNKYLND